MPSSQGRALQNRPVRARARGRLGKIVRVMLAMAIVVGLAHVPWRELRKRVLVLDAIDVEGALRLEPNRIATIAGLRVGEDLLEVDCARARQALLLHPRIERAAVERRWPRGVRVRVEERLPVMLVRHGVPWEIDSTGVLLAPLAQGVVSDVPLLSGPTFEGMPEGARIGTAGVQRGLAWVAALSKGDLQLAGQVSEVDVQDPGLTGLLLLEGTRVVAAAWPPSTRELSALRVVLADLKRRGTVAREVDLRYQGQVIVRPAARSETAAAPDSVRTAGA
jgi:cell division protein FtsQ